MRTKREISLDILALENLENRDEVVAGISYCKERSHKMKKLKKEIEEAEDEDYTFKNLLSRVEIEYDEKGWYLSVMEGDFYTENNEVVFDTVGRNKKVISNSTDLLQAIEKIYDFLMNFREDENNF